MKKDLITKDIVKTIALDIAIYILKLNINNLEFVDKELQRIEKREADVVAMCEIDGIKSILHLEIQNSNDKTMHRRMFRYYGDIKSRFEEFELYQYVVYIGKKPLSMKNEINERFLNFKYNLIDMHNINCEELIKLDTPDSLVLSVLCDFKGKNDIDVLMYIQQRISELVGDNSSEFSKYMLMLETLSENRDLKEKLKESEEMLKNIKLEQLPSYEIGLERGISQGLEKGISQGLEKGISQGLEIGILQGLSQGRLDGERVAKIEIAKNLLLSKVDINLIAKSTLLTIDEILTLQESLKK